MCGVVRAIRSRDLQRRPVHDSSGWIHASRLFTALGANEGSIFGVQACVMHLYPYCFHRLKSAKSLGIE